MTTPTDTLPAANARPMALLSWCLYVDCPACDEDFDLADYSSHNDYVIANAVFNNRWDDMKGHEVTCPNCEHGFELGGIEY